MKNNLLKQFIMMSKLLVYGVFLQCFFLSMLMASGLEAQRIKTVYEVQVDLKFEEAPLSEVLLAVESATPFHFSFIDSDIVKTEMLALTKRKQNVGELLMQISKQTGLAFRQVNNNINVKKTNSSSGYQKKIEVVIDGITITGKVTSAEDNESLPGVSVIVKGTSLGTVTDVEGNYSLDVSGKESILVFSSVGFIKKEVIVGNRIQIDVLLTPDLLSLEEIVVVGYGTQKKINITGAVDVISNKQIENRQAPTVSQLLQGLVPGVDFNVGENGFEPGARLNIDIRGLGSLNGGNPYILIDGFPGDLDRMNPEDIESISVLKDAAASAIYGARAPYGVILVTTKSGKKNEKLAATYGGSISVGYPMPFPDRIDSYTWARMFNEAGINRGGRSYSNDVIDRIIAYQNNDFDLLRPLLPEGATNFETQVMPDGTYGIKENAHANNDWFDILFGKSVNQKHNFSVQGGSEKTSYYFSAGYLGQEGVVNFTEDTYKRYNVTGKINTSIADWWDFGYEPRFMKSNRILPNMAGQGYTQFFYTLNSAAPSNPLYDAFGNNYALIQGLPVINTLESGNQNSIELTENWHTFNTEIRPAKGWDIYADFAYKSYDSYGSNVYQTVYYPNPDQSYTAAGAIPNQLIHTHYSNYYWTSNVYTSYTLNLEKGHNFYVMAGMQYELGNDRNMSVSKTNLIVQEVPSLQTAIGESIARENLGHWSTKGYFGRATYNYKERYLLESNLRYDGTSRFQEGNRWGLFPSFSGGWVISNENFWMPVSNYINTLKFRSSWGQLGNQNVNPYQDLALIPLRTGPLDWLFENGGTRPIGYTGTPDLVSNDLSWETATTINLGMNTEFLNHRLQFDFDWFERTTTDMIGPAEAAPGVLGARVPTSNNSTLRTRGWEAVLTWKQSFENGLSYFINMNMSDNTSIVTKYNNPDKLISNWYEGKEVGEIWGYTSNGLFQNKEEVDSHASQKFIFGSWRAGDIKLEDLNEDGIINNGSNTVDDPGDMKIIGSRSPHYQFGASLGLSFKGFDLSTLWRGTASMDIDQHFGRYGSQAYFGFLSASFSGLNKNHLDYFRDTPGDKYTGLYEGDANLNLDAWLPKPYMNSNENAKNRVPSTRYLLNGAYIRMQNIQLGYSLPSALTTRLHLTKLRAYISGENLLTFSEVPKGVDPVAYAGYNGTYLGYTYGADRTISFGITVTY